MSALTSVKLTGDIFLLCTHTAGVLALLEEPENELKVFALIRLNELVDNFWAEIAEDVTKMSAIHIL